MGPKKLNTYVFLVAFLILFIAPIISYEISSDRMPWQGFADLAITINWKRLYQKKPSLYLESGDAIWTYNFRIFTIINKM